MTPTEKSLPSIIEIMREGDYNPKEGRPVPIERIYEANTISYETYLQILREMKDEQRAYASAVTADSMGAESDALAERMSIAKAPKLYAHCAIDETHAGNLSSGSWLYVHGSDGDAVTRRACSAMKGWLRRNPFGSALFERSTTMTAALRDTKGEREAMSRFSTVGLLLISGIGAEVPTDLSLSNIHAVLDIRSGNGLPTIITSRHGASELAMHFGSRGNAGLARDLMDIIQRKAIRVQV